MKDKKPKTAGYGWTGKILVIDLSLKTHRTIYPNKKLYLNYIGGRGLAGYFLREHIQKDWQDLSMPLILMTGPLVGTDSPTSGRMTIMSKSPLNNTVGDTSVGGKLGLQLKKAGFDGIIIYGKSETLCGIEINDNEIQFHSAISFQNQIVSVVQKQIQNRGATAIVGPAGEIGVRFACIMVDGNHAAGRNGIGAVCGNKNLKYLTVKGSGSIAVFDQELLKKGKKDVFRLVAASQMLTGEHGISKNGTGALYDLIQSKRMLPTDNFQKTHFDAADELNIQHYKDKYQPKKSGCKGCHILCKLKTVDRHIPEYETMSHFTALIGNKNIDTVMEANHICAEYGMDTISAGATIACYREISGKDLSSGEIIEILKSIGKGVGIGRELMGGSYEYADNQNQPDKSMTVKKQEMPAYDPRGAYGMALAYSFSTRGGCHLRAYPISHEILRKPVATDRFTFSGKARIIKNSEDLNAVIDSLTVCKFVFLAATMEEYATVFKAVTGEEMKAQDLIKAGERICYNERIMNAKNGFSSKDDDLPPRFFKEAGSSGSGIAVNPIDRSDFLKARNNYYKIRGLSDDGIPTVENANRLDLIWNN